MAKDKNEENVATAEAAAPEAEATAAEATAPEAEATVAEATAPEAQPQTIILTSPTQEGLFQAFLDLKKEHKDNTTIVGAVAHNYEKGEYSLRVDIV